MIFQLRDIVTIKDIYLSVKIKAKRTTIPVISKDIEITLYRWQDDNYFKSFYLSSFMGSRNNKEVVE